MAAETPQPNNMNENKWWAKSKQTLNVCDGELKMIYGSINFKIFETMFIAHSKMSISGIENATFYYINKIALVFPFNLKM